MPLNKEEFQAKDFIPLYIELCQQLGASGYELIPRLLEIAEKEHAARLKPGKDRGQSWRPIKGAGLEKIIAYILRQELEVLNLELLSLRDVGDTLKIDFGEYGKHHPDVDMAVCQGNRQRILAILSIKSSLRERITQTAYWRYKLNNSPKTSHIKVFLVTPNSDNILRNDKEPKKPRAIVEADIDATYIVHLPGITIEDYFYAGKTSRIRLVDDLANELAKLALA